MEEKMESTIMCYIGTAARVHFHSQLTKGQCLVAAQLVSGIRVIVLQGYRIFRL